MIAKTLLVIVMFCGVISGLALSSLPARSIVDGTLEQKVAAMTGIPRTVDADLQNRANHRVIDIQTNFAHCCLVTGESEIIIWRTGDTTLGSLVQGWHDSPPHWAVMTNPAYTHVGCAYDVHGGAWYAVCIFSQALLLPASPHKRVPNTAMSHG